MAAIVTGEPVSAQTVSTLTKSLDRLVRRFHQAALRDEWAYLFLDGVSLRVRRPAGRKRVQKLVANGVRRDGPRRLDKDLPELLSFFQFPIHLWRKLRPPT